MSSFLESFAKEAINNYTQSKKEEDKNKKTFDSYGNVKDSNGNVVKDDSDDERKPVGHPPCPGQFIWAVLTDALQ